MEGYLSVPGGRVWYKQVGDGPGVPLVVLHGGPGFPHDYLEPLAALGDERPVILYDQLGCGRSDRPEDPALWTIERFVREVALLRRGLGLEHVALYGHSWGAILAIEYLRTGAPGVAGLILASPAISIPRWQADADRAMQQLPADVQLILQRHIAAGTVGTLDFEIATYEYYRKHVCRQEPWPEPLLRAGESSGALVYGTMWGPAEFLCSGTLRNYDGTKLLPAVSQPVLYTCGRYDEATPQTTAFYQSLTPRSELAVFENSSHMPHLEEPAAYLAVVRGFLRTIDPPSATGC